jgi:predicted ribosome quality control (RQC) complex YloA/Tae2 family protein
MKKREKRKMRTKMKNSLDFFLACRWLEENLPGARIEKKILRFPDGTIGVEVYSRKIGGKRILALGKGTIGFMEEAAPAETWIFGRQFLSGLTVRAAGQLGFDRIFKLDADGVSLVAEVFDGNILLLKGGKITYCAKPRAWAGRKLFVGEAYVTPAGPAKLPGELTAGDIPSGEPIGKILAVRLGFGPEISGAICEKAGVAKEKTPINLEEREKIVSAISEIFSAEPAEPVAKIGEKEPASERDDGRREKILAQAGELEKEAEEARSAAGKILENLGAIDEAIGKAKAGDWKPDGIVAEARKKEGRLLLDL